MNFFHKDLMAGPNHIIFVDLDTQANVLLMDDLNYNAYRRGQSCKYYGGWVKQTPVRLRPHHRGRWHVVVDLGDASGRIRAGIRILSA